MRINKPSLPIDKFWLWLKKLELQEPMCSVYTSRHVLDEAVQAALDLPQVKKRK